MLLSRRARQLLRQLRSADDNQPTVEREEGIPQAPLEAPPEAAAQRGSVVARAVRSALRRSARPAPPLPPSGPLEELVPGRVMESAEGTCYLVQAPATELLPEAAPVLARLPEALRATASVTDDARLAPLRDTRFDQLALLDIETAGLSAAPIFLVGLTLWPSNRAEDAVVHQLMARDYTEEAPMLAETARLLRGCRVLITYNGRSFDFPLMQERTVYHRLERLKEPECHLDLLRVVRKRFRGRWEDCRLQTLERELCGRERWNDIDGADIPRAYHDFVESGDAGQMKLVIEHNRLDLLSMLEILVRITTPNELP